MLSQLREQSRLVQELRENEAKANREDLTRAAQQLEQDRLVVSNKARRLQEDLKVAQEVRDVALKKATELKAMLGKVKQESRREVDVLRAKLGEVTKDAEGKVAEMQNKLSEALEKYAEVIKKAKLLEDTSKRLQYEQEQAKLNDRLDQSATIAKLKKELIATQQDSSLKVQAELLTLKEQSELENEVHKALKVQHENLKLIVKGLEAKLDGAEAKNKTLANSEHNEKAELQNVKRQLDDVVHDRDLLQKRLEEEKKSCTQRAIDDREAIVTLTSAKDILESRLQELQQRLSATATVQSGREWSSAQVEKLVAETSLFKSQLSSSQRTLEEAQEKTRQAESQHKANESRLRDQIKSLQEKLNAAFSKADEQTEKLFELQRCKRQLEQENSSLKVAVSHVESLNKSLQVKVSKSADETSAFERAKKESEAMERELTTLTAARNQLTSAVSTLEMEKGKLQITVSELETSLLNCKRKSEAQELEICLIQRSMKSLEEQHSETQVTMREMKTQEEQWKQRQHVLEGDLEISEGQLDDAQAMAEKEKVARLAAESKTNELLATLDGVNASHAEDMQRIQQLLVAQKQLAAKCSDERVLAERQLQFKELRLAEVEKEMSTEKQLTSKLFDDLHSIRREYNMLRAAYNKLAQECEQRQAQLAQVDHTLREKESAESARSIQETRLQTTIAQQSKLIDYLQSSGVCSSSTPLGNMLKSSAGFKHSSRKSRDPTKQMAEWDDLKGLASKAKGGVAWDSPVSCPVSSSPAPTPSKPLQSHEATSKPKVTSVEAMEVKDATTSELLPPVMQQSKKRAGGLIMQHNIPHSFKEKGAPIYKSYVCVVCKGNIRARQKLCKCTHCDVVCHPNCVSSIPNTCGLPAELAEHMVGQGEEPLSKRPRSDEGTEKENSGEEEICLDVGATKRTTSIVVRKEKMTMFRPGSDLKVYGWLILGVDTLSFSTRDSSRRERRPDVHVQLRAPDTTFVVNDRVQCRQIPFLSPAKVTINAFMLEQHTLTTSTCYLFVAPDVESKFQWVKCLGKAIAGETQDPPCTSRELKSVMIVPLKSSSDALNISVTSSMLDDSVV